MGKQTKPVPTDKQYLVLMCFINQPMQKLHAYKIAQMLGETGYPISERAITEIFKKYAAEGILERDERLESNPLGPARVNYSLKDPDRAIRLIAAKVEHETILILTGRVVLAESIQQLSNRRPN